MSSTVEVKTKGWCPDPSGKYEWRYWDGGWPNRVANSAAPAAAARALAAMLGVRLRPMRWVNMTLAVVVACLVARELIDVNQQITNMNVAVIVKADVGIGLSIMLVSAAGALIASFRIGSPE